MKESDRYLKIVEWSDEDQKYIGTCPELFYGGCDGHDEAKVYEELCQIVDEVIEMIMEDGDPLPEPKPRGEHSGAFVYPTGERMDMECVGVREEAAAYDPGPPPSKKKMKASAVARQKPCHKRV